MEKQIRLSQCMIVKNEEKNIRKALSWGKRVVCEQVVVDTGSTDRTVELAKQMGATVYHYPWNGDFSAAKNFALEKTSGDWVAFLDADEYFAEEVVDKILPLLEKIESLPAERRFHAVKCTLLNLDDGGRAFSTMEQTRLLKRGTVCYEKKIHEILKPRGIPSIRCLNAGDTLVIYHTGYSPGAFRETGKRERNIEMIKRVLEEEPENYDYWSYLGDSWFSCGRDLDAREAYETVIRHSDVPMDLSRLDTALSNLVRIYIRCGDEDTEKNIRNLLEVFEKSGSDCPDVDYWVGIYAISRNRKAEGCRHLEQSLKNMETYRRGAALISTGELKTIYGLLEHAYAELGEPALAVKYGVLALRMDRYQLYELRDLIGLLQGEPEDAVAAFLGKIYNMNELKDKLYLIKAARQAKAHALEQKLYRLLSLEEQRWLDRRTESPYGLSADEQKERYPSIICQNRTDACFLELMEELRIEPAGYLIEQLKEKLVQFKERQGNYDAFLECFRQYDCWGRLVPEAGIYEALERRAASLKEHREDFLWLYEQLGDNRSKRSLTAILDNWLHLESHGLEQARECGPYFFDTDLIPSARDMVYLDLGTTDCQSAWDFIQTYGETYRNLYCHTDQLPEDSLYRRKITACERVTILEERPGREFFDSGCIPRLSFMKLDVEGNLPRLLEEYKTVIDRDHPALAMCVDDGYELIWRAARQIRETAPSYRFYLRYYGGNLIPTKFVLYAVQG